MFAHFFNITCYQRWSDREELVWALLLHAISVFFFCKNQSSEIGWLWNWSSSNPIYNPCTLPLPSHHLPQDSTPPIWVDFNWSNHPSEKSIPPQAPNHQPPKKPKSPQQKKTEKIYPHSAFISSNTRSLRYFFDSNVQSRWVCGEGSSAPPGRKDWGCHDCHGVASCWWSMIDNTMKY